MDRIDRPFVDKIATQIDLHGIATAESGVAAIAAAARESGVTPIIVQVLADLDEPANARERAFGLVATRLLRAGVVHDVEVRHAGTIHRETVAA